MLQNKKYIQWNNDIMLESINILNDVLSFIDTTNLF